MLAPPRGLTPSPTGIPGSAPGFHFKILPILFRNLMNLPLNKILIDLQLSLSAICLPTFKMCDGDYNLNSGLDEENCAEWTCAEGYRKCDDNLRCIPEWKFCDWAYDCLDDSDEKSTFQQPIRGGSRTSHMRGRQPYIF